MNGPQSRRSGGYGAAAADTNSDASSGRGWKKTEAPQPFEQPWGPGVVQGEPLYGCGEPVHPNHADGASRFVVDGPKDAWAAGLFLLHLVLIAVTALGNYQAAAARGVSLFDVGAPGPPHPQQLVTPLRAGQAAGAAGRPVDLGSFVGGSVVLAGLLAFAVLMLMRSSPAQFIFVSGMVSGGVTAIIGLVALGGGNLLVGLLVTFSGVLGMWLTWALRHRIPFAAVLLGAAIDNAFHNWGTIVTSVGSLAALAAYFAAWLAAAAPTLTQMARAAAQAQQVRRARRHGMPLGDTAPVEVPLAALLALVFCLFWAGHVATNVAHVTTAGVVASWYFIGASMPATATTAALRRALSTSFGSICLGSMVVALLNTIHFALRLARHAAQDDGREAAAFVLCVLECVTDMVEGMIEYFNVYAFTNVAIYGSSYVTAAKHTWRLVKHSGWAAIFNDNLIFPALTVASLAGAAGCGVVMGLLFGNVGLGLLAGFIGLQSFSIVLNVIYSAVVTIFVCVAECPEAMESTNPEFAARMHEAAAAYGGGIGGRHLV